MCAFIQGGFKGPWMAVEGGMHWSVEYSYQAPPNVHTKYALFSDICTCLTTKTSKIDIKKFLLAFEYHIPKLKFYLF